MANIFEMINNFINTSTEKTYGDLLNENKQEVKQNSIRRMCSQEEYEEYESLYAFDKDKLIKENYSELKDNYLMSNMKGKEQYISGIGIVKQIC